MGARVGRMFRNFNLENRVHREIAKEKPRLAPRHAVTEPQQQPPAAAATSGGGELSGFEAVSSAVKPGLGFDRRVTGPADSP